MHAKRIFKHGFQVSIPPGCENSDTGRDDIIQLANPASADAHSPKPYKADDVFTIIRRYLRSSA